MISVRQNISSLLLVNTSNLDIMSSEVKLITHWFLKQQSSRIIKYGIAGKNSRLWMSTLYLYIPKPPQRQLTQRRFLMICYIFEYFFWRMINNLIRTGTILLTHTPLMVAICLLGWSKSSHWEFVCEGDQFLPCAVVAR